MDFGHSPCSTISLLFPYICLWPQEKRGFYHNWLAVGHDCLAKKCPILTVLMTETLLKNNNLKDSYDLEV